MARYLKTPQQQFVNMYSPLNMEYYTNAIDKAQQNLNQSSAMQAKFMEDVYGIKHFDEATHKAQVGKVEQAVSGALDDDFVNPANVVKTISKASQGFTPYKNLVERQLEEVKRQQDQKDRWSSNWIGNDVSSMSLTAPETGELISADKIRAISGNREDLTSAFSKDLAGLADKITEIPGGWNTILGGKAYEKKTTKIKGLTESQRVALLNEGKLVKQYMEQLPGFAEAVAASGMNPEEYIAKELDTWTKQLVKGEEVDSKYLDNPGWGKAAPTNPLEGSKYVQELSQEEANKSVEDDFNSLKEARKNSKLVADKINNSLGNKALRWSGVGALWNPIINIWNWEGEQLGIKAKLPTIDNKIVTPEEVQQNATKAINTLKTTYAPIYKKLKSSGNYGNEKTGYNYSKLEDDFLDNIEQIESIMRQTSSLKAEVDPAEVPKFYSSILNKTDNGDILKEINPDGTVSDEGISYDDMTVSSGASAGKLKSSFEAASITINPISGRPEMTDVAGKKKYAVDRNRLDIHVKKALENSEKAYALHKKQLIDGTFFTQSPEEQEQDLLDLQTVANKADLLFRAYYK